MKDKVKKIKVYNLVLQNKSNKWEFETKYKYPKNIDINQIKETSDDNDVYYTTNMQIVRYLNPTEMSQKEYEIQLENALKIYNNVLKLEQKKYDDEEESVLSKPSLSLIKTKILSDYKKITIEFGDMMGGKGDDNDDMIKIGQAQALWSLLKSLNLTKGLNEPPEYPEEYTQWTAKTGTTSTRD